LIILGIPITLTGQSQTVGLTLNEPSSFSGYTLFAPAAYSETYLIDNEGFLVNSWQSHYTPGLSVYLLQNGNLLRTASIHNPTLHGGGSGGLLEEYTWDGNLVWEYEYSTSLIHQHHDIEKLPNGNVLLIAWEYKDFNEAIQAGRRPGLLSQHQLWPDHIVEVKADYPKGGQIVWEWHVWDHLIQDYNPIVDNYGEVANHPELIDINYVSPGPNGIDPDWNHINAIDYNDSLDQIILTVAKFSEIWIIDHSTTTEEAAGHTGGRSGKGGDLLYRWGNPQTYRRGNNSEQKLFSPHDGHWIESSLPGEGNILIFNNRKRLPAGQYSSIDEIVPQIDQQGKYLLNNDSTFFPDTLFYSYTDPNPTSFFAVNISGAQRLPNGNTLICEGPTGKFFEVTVEGDLVWQYVNPVIKSGPMIQGDPIPEKENRVFRIHRYSPDYPGFLDHELTHGNQIERYPTSREMIGTEFNSENNKLFKIYPIPTKDILNIETRNHRQFQIKITSLNGQLLFSKELEESIHQINLSSFKKGVYFITIRSKDFVTTKKILKL